MKKRRHKKNSANCADQTHQKGKRYCCMYGVMHALFIFLAKILGYNNPRTGRQSGKKSDKGIYDAVRCTYRRKCFFSHKIADHNTVYRIVKLLKNIPQHQGKCKQKNVFPDSALCHKRIFFSCCCHKASVSLLSCLP